MSYILAFDQGTTSSRSIIFDSDARVVASSQREFQQIYPEPGWVEHDPLEIWRTQSGTAIEAIQKAGISFKDIVAAGVTNQRETTIVWDRVTGNPLYNAIVWQDRRTTDYCNAMRLRHAELIRWKTGLEIDSYFSASKIRWILDNVDGARAKAENGDLAFGTVDSWLIWQFTNGRHHITDVSNASRTLLFDINKLEWDNELLDLFEVPKSLLPKVGPSSEVRCEIEAPNELRSIPIAGIAGDQQAALFGQQCFNEGEAKTTYGTGCFMLQNTGPKPVNSTNRLLSTVAWTLGAETYYALEGSVFIGGAVIQWLRDGLGIIAASRDAEALARSVPDSGGVYFVPAFAGLGAPHWDQEARGLIIGLTRGTGKAQLARAAIESIAFQTAELLESAEADSGVTLKDLRVDGGAAANNLLMQFQADILQIPILRTANLEATALGAAYLAGLAVGFWRSAEAFIGHKTTGHTFEPQMPPETGRALRLRWAEAVERSKAWNK